MAYGPCKRPASVPTAAQMQALLINRIFRFMSRTHPLDAIGSKATALVCHCPGCLELWQLFVHPEAMKQALKAR